VQRNPPTDLRRDRQIRVFVSSTFRDMKEERDHLVKFIFPQLRKLCESRGVVWGEVDLRWGVTDEQKADGKVLPICLEEIKRCRPYFIGLLGERYGWIPETIPPEIIEREPWLAEHVHGRKSVTELEILHGVLNNPDMAEHAFFYFRDPAYVESLSPDKKKDFTAEGDGDGERLRNLKKRIRTSGFPVYENYPDPKALGGLVLADLTVVIDKRWPEGSQPDPLGRDAMDHEAYAQSRERVYIARPEYFAKLDAHADGTGDQPLVILGESGCGKSALLANWVKHYRAEHPKVLVLQHYIGATPYSADWATMLRRLMGEFRRHLGIQQDIPDKPDELRSAFPNWLYMAAAKGRVVLVMDALNQLEDRDGAPDLVWLPPVMPENLRLIVSTLPGRPLDEIRKRAWPTLEVGPLLEPERETLIGEYLAQYAKVLSPARVQRIAAAPQSANPLYLRVLLEELHVFGEHERLDERITHYIVAPTVTDLYERVLGRYEEDYEQDCPGLVQDAMAVLWAARCGLSAGELLDILGEDGRPFPRAHWSPLFLAMEHSLINRSGLIGFSHDDIRQAVRRKYLTEPSYERAAHLCLSDYFRKRDINSRKLEELPWQLAQAREWPELYAVLGDLAFLEAAWDADRFEVKAFWVQVEQASSYRMVDAYLFPNARKPQLVTTGQASAVGRLLQGAGHPKEALWYYDRLIDFYREKSDRPGLEAALGGKAAIIFKQGDSAGALELHREQEALCRELGKREALAACLGNLAQVLSMLGRHDEAIQAAREGEQLLMRHGTPLELARASVIAGVSEALQRGSDTKDVGVLDALERGARTQGNKEELIVAIESRFHSLLSDGHFQEAEQNLNEREHLASAIGYPEGLAAVYGDRATLAREQGLLPQALALQKQRELLYRELNHSLGVGAAIGAQAEILRDMGDTHGAGALWRQEIDVLRSIGARAIIVVPMNELAVQAIREKRYDEALELLIEQDRLCREMGQKGNLAAALGNQAFVLDARGEWTRAMELLTEQETLCREMNDLRQLGICLNGQAHLLSHHLGNVDEALSKCQEAMRYMTGPEGATHRAQSEKLLKEIRRNLPGKMAIGSVVAVGAGMAVAGVALGLSNPWLWLLGAPMALAPVLFGVALVFLRFTPTGRMSMAASKRVRSHRRRR